MGNWSALADRILAKQDLTKDEALSVLRSPDVELLEVLGAAYKIRHHYHGNKVKLHVLENAMSGMCPEDCKFCSQSNISTGEVERYRLETKDEMVAAAKKAKAAGAYKYCIVTSTRGPSDPQLTTICAAVKEIKETVGIRVCTSLGILERHQATQLKEAGVDRFNHNLESSARHFPEICSTHAYEDRVRTIGYVQDAGMESCCGGIVGMGEKDEDLVELAFELCRLGVTSIPINFLNPRPGTPLGNQPLQDPKKCLKVLCMVRFANPSRDVRCAGGREVVLRSMQSLALYPCNSIFTNGYLTTGGNADDADTRMIREMGFEIYTE